MSHIYDNENIEKDRSDEACHAADHMYGKLARCLTGGNQIAGLCERLGALLVG